MIDRVAIAALALGLAMPAAAFARETGGTTNETPARQNVTQSTYGIPLWVPSWLRVPLRRALADATAPRDRHPPR